MVQRAIPTFAIAELHIHQLLMLVHTFLHHKHLLPTAFVNYFTISSAVHLYNRPTRVRENLHLDSVSTSYGKRTVRYRLIDKHISRRVTRRFSCQKDMFSEMV